MHGPSTVEPGGVLSRLGFYPQIIVPSIIFIENIICAARPGIRVRQQKKIQMPVRPLNFLHLNVVGI